LTVAVILTAAALLLRLPAGVSAARSAAQGTAGNVAFLSGGFDGSLRVVNAVGQDPSGGLQESPPGTAVWAYAWSPKCNNDAKRVGKGWLVLSKCWIAYIAASDGSLWLTGFGGSGSRLLLAGSRLASTAISWSPNGREIAITSPGRYTKRSLPSCGKQRIYLVPIDGSNPRELRLAASACDGIAWSPRGDEIAYGGPGGVFVIHPDGSGRLRLSTKGWGWLGWSADGTQLAFAVALRTDPLSGLYAGIAVVNADGSDFHIVTKNADNEYPAVWSPKGHRLLYGRANSGGIYVIDANGRNDRRVTTDSPLGSEEPELAWSPDGDWIVYGDRQGGLYEVGINGHGKTQLTSPSNRDGDPSWISPGWFWG
jgi:Tol biopolymer transport system component